MATSESKVAIITGSSRGIGRALALGLARDGWSVVIAARSTSSTDKLPGSIFTVAQEVEASGGEALPIAIDLRDEAQIEALATRTLDRFGRIDLLVNNAGALFWQKLIDTPAKKFDLVLAVNSRAAFLCCRAVLPAMMKARQGHIINMSPPFDPAMLPGRVAYGISKLGMTLLTIGLARETLPDNIAVNSLWPKTLIESQATIHWGLGKPETWRKPAIILDCVRRIVQKTAAQLTGQTLVDEDFLRAEGVTDFSPYACVPGTNPPRASWPDLAG